MRPAPRPDALTVALVEIEHHLAADGWDQPPRLFALAPTAQLLTVEPGMAAALGITDVQGIGEDALTPIEQEALDATRSLDTVLAAISWPSSVLGCALAVERLVLPPSAESALPRPGQADDATLRAAAAAHPERQELRVVVGVTRAGAVACAVRIRGHEADTDLLLDPAMAPGLVQALRDTLTD